AGAGGYVGWGATSLDTAIAIRCALVQKDRVVVQAGAGIVADSDPAREFAGTEAKAQAVLRALALAKAGPWRILSACVQAAEHVGRAVHRPPARTPRGRGAGGHGRRGDSVSP